jgi:hypothetical protein
MIRKRLSVACIAYVLHGSGRARGRALGIFSSAMKSVRVIILR